MSNKKTNGEIAEIKEEIINAEAPAEEKIKEEIKEEAPKKEDAAPKKTRRHKKASAAHAEDEKNEQAVRENVISEYGPQMTESEEEAKRWNEIISYYKSGRIIKAPITVTDIGSNNTVRFSVSLNDFRVLIPEKECFVESDFRKDFEEMSEEEKHQRRVKIASRMIGASIPFIIIAVEKQKLPDGSYDYAIIGSRKQAMDQLRDAAFFGPKGPIVKIGDIVEASVLSRGADAIKVSCHGVETIIQGHDLSNRHWVKDCTEEVGQGETIRCKITALDVNPETKIVRMRLSRRALDIDAMARNALKMTIGSRAMGEVVSYNKEKETYTIALLNGVTARVRKSRVMGRDILTLGSKVIVEVKRIDERGFVEGSCLKTN